MKREPVAVLGGGAWGTMLAHLLSYNNERVLHWVREEPIREEIARHRTHTQALPGLTLSDRIFPEKDLETVVRSADVLVIAVPSQSFRDVVRRFSDVVQGDQLVVWGTRGLEEGSNLRMSEIVMQESCVRLTGALAGPAFAEELVKGQPAALVIGSRFDAVIQRMQTLLGSHQVRVYGNQDLLGVELAGAFSTIISLACGITSGLGFEAGSRAMVLTRGLAEISRLGVAMGAEPETFIGLTALGDLIATVLAGASRSYRLGERLAKGEGLAQALEAIGPAECVPTSRVAAALIQRHKVEAPLMLAMHGLLFEGRQPAELVKALMLRRSTYE